jgi:phosphatidylglycerol lysyltransferase
MKLKTLGRSTAISRSVVARQAGRIGLSLGILGASLALLAQQLGGFDSAQMHLAFMAVSAPQWALALCLVIISYAAIGQYDVLILRHLAMRHPEVQVRRAGITALAISQTVGMGLLSGALVRWRMLPALRFAEALRITFAVSVSFLLAAGVVTAVIHAVFGRQGQLLAIGVLCAAGVFVALSIARPRWRQWTWPNLFTLGGMVALAAIDVTAAGAALWVLLPSAEVGFAVLMPAFLLALLGGMISGTPGGLGAFELVILAQVTTLDPEGLLAAVMAWRLVYFAIPSVLALPALAMGGGAEDADPGPPQNDAATLDWSEAGLLRQGHLSTLSIGQGRGIAVGRTGHTLICLGGPGTEDLGRAFQHLRLTAKAEGRLPAFYKIPPRLAALARQRGMSVTKIGADAIIAPQNFSPTTPSRASLRRKLRKAIAAGVGVAECGAQIPPSLNPIAAGWAAQHGGERGFSMGRFCPRYLAHQRVFVAQHKGRDIAFISLHVAKDVWTLDLMRQERTVPDGTMHLLVAHAIDQARRNGVAEVNLAAVPIGAFGGAPTIFRFLSHHGGGNGLWQFKASFDPVWRPLYLAAHGRVGTSVVALGLIRAIHRPPPLQPANEGSADPVTRT